jgi:alpha/beta superfamily hydrolase
VDPTAASLALTTADGVALTADLAVPDGARAGAVLLHPHPRFGGDRRNVVVDALYRRLPAAGIAALRFDFRPGAGADGGDLANERTDAIAALDALAIHVPDRALVAAGYSFGAEVALMVDHPALAAVVAIAPTLAVAASRPPSVPTLVLVAEHDQFSPPDTVAPMIRDWPGTTIDVIDGADHFLAGHAGAVADRAARWLVEQAAR